MNFKANMERQQLALAESMVAEQQHKEALALGSLRAATKSEAATSRAIDEILKKAIAERKTAELIQQSTADAIERDRSQPQQD